VKFRFSDSALLKRLAASLIGGSVFVSAPLFGQGVTSTTSSDPHGGVQQPIIHGSPFASLAHRHQAELLRANRNEGLRTQNMPGEGIPPGTIGLLVRNELNEPLAGAKVKLLITHESIAEGNTDTTKETTTDLQGRGGFIGLSTETSYKYEAVIDFDGARYQTGEIRLRREVGHIALLYVFPTTPNIDDTFVISRLLYALQPREDIFQIDTILRIQNGGNKTWVPKDLFLDLPEGALAFRPAKVVGDIRTTQDGNRVHITGSFTPGQHELTFGFQVENHAAPDGHACISRGFGQDGFASRRAPPRRTNARFGRTERTHGSRRFSGA
jgi:hypothetical protein